MNNKILTALVLFSMLPCVIYTVSAGSCPYDDDYKYGLQKALVGYLKAPSSSTMSLGEVQQMLNFYLINPSVTDVDCPPQISAAVSKADSQIPDSVMDFLGNRWNSECTTCSDGSLCEQTNQVGQNCKCIDIDDNGKNEFCYLEPFMVFNATCEACPDGTACGQTNQKGQICKCKDWNYDGKTEYCALRPREASGSTTTQASTTTTQASTTTTINPTTTTLVNATTSTAVSTTQNTSTSSTTYPITTTTIPTTSTIVSTTLPATTLPATTLPVTTSQITTTTMSGGTQCAQSGGTCEPAGACNDPSPVQGDCSIGLICCPGGQGSYCEQYGGTCTGAGACNDPSPVQGDCIAGLVCCGNPMY